MSAFWVQKIKTYFTRIDFDHDGAITKKDFEGMANRFVESEKLDATRGADLRAKLTMVWDKYLHTLAKSDAIALPQFVEAMKKLKTENKLKEVIEGPLPIFFSAIDANADGQIQEDEYQLLFQILGIDPKLAPPSFKAIDTNHDGQLSKDEFITAGIDFFLSEDESCPTKLFWGPLVH